MLSRAALLSAVCLVATCCLDTGKAFVLVHKTAKSNNTGSRNHGEASTAHNPPLDGVGFGAGLNLPRRSGFAARLPRVPSAMDQEETSRARWCPLRLNDVFGLEEAGQQCGEVIPPPPPPAKAKRKVMLTTTGEELPPDQVAAIETMNRNLFGTDLEEEEEWGEVETVMEKEVVVEEGRNLMPHWVRSVPITTATADDVAEREYRWTLPEVAAAERARENRRLLTYTHFDDPDYVYTLSTTRAERSVFYTGGWGGWFYREP